MFISSFGIKFLLSFFFSHQVLLGLGTIHLGEVYSILFFWFFVFLVAWVKRALGGVEVDVGHKVLPPL